MKTRKFTLSEMPGKKELLNNGMTRVFIDVERKEETISGEDGESTINMVYLCEAVDVAELTRPSIISAIVRSRYSQDDVEAILANGNDEEHAQEWQEFQDWRKKAKDVVMMC